MCEEYGGRVELAKAYYKGLSESLVKNFNGSGLISSMQQCNDFFFLGTQDISMGRVGKKIKILIALSLYIMIPYYKDEAHLFDLILLLIFFFCRR